MQKYWLRLGPVAMLAFSLSTIITLALPTYPSFKLNSGIDNFRLVVTVVRSDREDVPVEGASVYFAYRYDPKFQPIRLDTLPTNKDGMVWLAPSTYGGFLKIEPKPGAIFEITVSNSGFEDSHFSIPVSKWSGDLSVTISLKRKGRGKLVDVSVFSNGDRAPIYDAVVQLNGVKSGERFTESTNSEGRALINVTESGDYEISVTHAGYAPEKSKVSIKIYSDDPDPEFVFSMKSSSDSDRLLNVSVSGRNKEGKIVPVRYASVTLPDGQQKTTDYSGKVNFTHKLPPGQDAKVQAEATYYKPGSNTFFVGITGLAGDSVSIQLEWDNSNGDKGDNDNIIRKLRLKRSFNGAAPTQVAPSIQQLRSLADHPDLLVKKIGKTVIGMEKAHGVIARSREQARNVTTKEVTRATRRREASTAAQLQ